MKIQKRHKNEVEALYFTNLRKTAKETQNEEHANQKFAYLFPDSL